LRGAKKGNGWQKKKIEIMRKMSYNNLINRERVMRQKGTMRERERG